MEATRTPYLIERQAEAGAEWRPVARCSSLIYARAIALAGIRTGAGVRYRAIHTRTGRITPLNSTGLTATATS